MGADLALLGAGFVIGVLAAAVLAFALRPPLDDGPRGPRDRR